MSTIDRRGALVIGGVTIAILLIGLAAIRGGGEGTGPAQTEALVRSQASDSGLTRSGPPSGITVDVSGAVRRPGVYRLEQGMRVIDAISRAGGPIASAFPSGINRAALLVDGQQVVVPARGRGGQATAVGAEAGPISLGTATQAELEEIDGIGPVTAGKIIEFRNQRGGVASIDELDQISGIGPATLEGLRSGLQP